MSPHAVSDNSIWYRGYRIYPSDAPFREVQWAFCHDDFDGAEDSGDTRYGYAESVDACKALIDEKEDD